ncbi:MAG: ABC transporter permease subunit [Oscillospiraceae bacterium]|nr:ABC transporter permease subunit [Oscillospiraceae bacterium]
MKMKKITAFLLTVIIFCGTVPRASANTGLMRTPDDLADKRIGVVTASVQDIHSTEHYPNADIHRFGTVADTLAALKADRVDAVMGGFTVLRKAQQQDDSLVFLEEMINPLPIGMAFQKGDALIDSFNDFLNQIKSDGTFDDMLRRYFTDDDYEMPQIVSDNQNGRLLYGVTTLGGLPYASISNGGFVGIEIEFARRFASLMGMELVIRDIDFTGLIASLAAGKVQMIGGGLFITEERKRTVDFSDPVYMEHSAVLVKRDKMDLSAAAQYDSEDIVSPEALRISDGKIIGAMSGSNSAIMLDVQAPGATLRHYDDIVDAVLALKAGRVDYVLTSTTRAKAFLYQDPSLEIVPDVIVVHRAPSIGVSKDKPELRERIDEAIDKLREDGTLADLERRWVKFDGTPYEPADIEPVDGDQVLRVAFASSSEPISFKDENGNPAGLDADLSRYIARELGMRIEFLDLNFTAMVAAVQSGKADMAISNISATLERKNAMDFTQEYFSNPQVFLRLKIDAPPAAIAFLEGLKESFYRNIILERRYMLVLNGLCVTVVLSLLALVFGTVLGGLICAMRMAKNAAIREIAKAYISILRGIPVLVVLMVIYYIVFASVDIDTFLVATIAFGMNFAAYVAEMFRTGIESVDKSQREAGIAGGFNPLQTFIYIIMPQAARLILPVYKGEFISLVKMTSVVGYIAVQDLTKAGDIIRSRTMEAFFPLIMVAVLYFVISWLLSLSLTYIEKRVDPKFGRVKL